MWKQKSRGEIQISERNAFHNVVDITQSYQWKKAGKL